MKHIYLFTFLAVFINSCSSQEKTSKKTFDDIALVNKIEFFNAKLDQAKFSCGFLLKHHNDTFAITAKHLLKVIKPEEMTALSFENVIKNWSLYPLDKPADSIVTGKLLNENKSELLKDDKSYNEDWLAFSIASNHSKIKPLEVRTTPLVPGEKLYVVGWTRKMESGSQRVYEFEFFKKVNNRLLLKEVIVPEKFGGLSGGPVVDEQDL